MNYSFKGNEGAAFSPDAFAEVVLFDKTTVCENWLLLQGRNSSEGMLNCHE